MLTKKIFNISCFLVMACYSTTSAMEKTTQETAANNGYSPSLFMAKMQYIASEMQELFNIFSHSVQKTIATYKHIIESKKHWILEEIASEEFGKLCIPYVQKLLVKPGQTLYIFGDLHSNPPLEALKKLQLDGILTTNWEIANNNHLIFLGDYVDRGLQGVETWFTLCKLRIANPDPDSLILLRGNHEDLEMNDMFSTYDNNNGYVYELQKKFGLPSYHKRSVNNTQYKNLTTKLYNCLPVALYITCNSTHILCVHGGLEIGFNPKTLLANTDVRKKYMRLGKLQRKTFTEQLPEALKEEVSALINPLDIDEPIIDDLHFLWNDFSDKQESIKSERGDPIMLMGTRLTDNLLKRDALTCVFRGHHHDLAFLQKPYGLHHSITNQVHTILSFNFMNGYEKLCTNYSFVKIVTGETFNEWKAWHLHDGQEYPFDLAIKHPEEIIKTVDEKSIDLGIADDDLVLSDSDEENENKGKVPGTTNKKDKP